MLLCFCFSNEFFFCPARVNCDTVSYRRGVGFGIGFAAAGASCALSEGRVQSLVCRSRAAEDSSLSKREQPLYIGGRFFRGGTRRPSRVRKNCQRRSSHLSWRAKESEWQDVFFSKRSGQKLVGDNCGEKCRLSRGQFHLTLQYSRVE